MNANKRIIPRDAKTQRRLRGMFGGLAVTLYVWRGRREDRVTLPRSFVRFLFSAPLRLRASALTSGILRKLLLMFVVLMQVGMSRCVAAEEEPLPGRLTGTYLQLWDGHGEWNEGKWRELFKHFQALELDWLVIQWTLYGSRAFYPSEIHEPVLHPPLETVMRLADEAGMKVFVGLAHDESYWMNIDREPDLLDVYLQRLNVHSLTVAREVKEIVEDHPSFEGWYISQEIDDVHWLEPARKRILVDALTCLAMQLVEEVPKARVAISGFSNAHADPEALGRFWAQLVGSGLDVVLFQDGIGVRKLDLRHLPIYLGALRKAVELEEGELWVVVENFRQIEGPPIDDGPFKAVPASLARLTRQLELAVAHTSRELIAFSVPEYMTPLGGKEAQKLFEAYRRKLKETANERK